MNPQSECNYGVTYKNVSMLTRTDGIVVQAVEGGDMKGYKDDHDVVDRAEAETAVNTVEALFTKRSKGRCA